MDQPAPSVLLIKTPAVKSGMFLSAMAKSFPLLPWAKFSRSEAALFPGVSDHPAIGQRLAKGFFVNVSLLRFFPSD